MNQVIATHTLLATGEPACEIYPDVFISTRPGVFTPYSGQPHPCDPLPADVPVAFEITEGHIKLAAEWAELIHHPTRGAAQKIKDRQANRSGHKLPQF